jgi:hypothetical protein
MMAGPWDREEFSVFIHGPNLTQRLRSWKSGIEKKVIKNTHMYPIGRDRYRGWGRIRETKASTCRRIQRGKQIFYSLNELCAVLKAVGSFIRMPLLFSFAEENEFIEHSLTL